MNTATDPLRGYPILPVEATHRLRVLTGYGAGVTFRLAWERVRVGRPYCQRDDEFMIGEALVGRNVYMVRDGAGGTGSRLSARARWGGGR